VESDDLQSLVPVASTNIVLDDGLVLPTRNTWHARHPPVLQIATLSDAECEVELLCIQDLSNRDADQSAVNLGNFKQSGTFELASTGMAPGDYRVVVKELSAKLSSAIASAAVRLRNAEHRRTVKPLFLAHLSATEQPLGWAISAVAAGSCKEQPAITGTVVQNWPDERPVTEQPLEIPATLSQRSGEQEQPPELEDVASSEGDIETPSCIVRGHHIWALPPEEVSHPRYQTLLGSCKDCGLEKWFGSRPTRRRGRSRMKRGLPDFEPRVIDVRFSNSKHDVSADTLFDALCHIGVANRRTVANLVDSFSSHPWMTDEMLRTLSALGHIEVVLNPESFQITDWEVSGPILNYTSEATAFLSGYRTPSLVARLREDASALGLQFKVVRQANAPSRISVHGIGERDVEDLADSISQSTGVSIQISVRPSRAIAARLPNLKALMRQIPTSPLSSSPCQYFDLESLKWIDVGKPERTGAYRFKTWTWSYAFVDENLLREGLQMCGDYRTIKHIAAAASGSPLLAFDEASGNLAVPLGAELPWLYERAVVLETGLAPVSMTNGQVLYSCVSRPVAELIWSAMLA
jgi:hypothetical protein